MYVVWVDSCRYIRIYYWVRKVLEFDIFVIILYSNNILGDLRKFYGKRDGIRDRKSVK